ncbi:MAG TPA: DUF5655 domain-containing protein [Acidimicrobiales bacterium]
MALEEYFATGPSHERPIFDAVMARLGDEGLDVFVEPVSVGIFLKRARTFADLRPMQRWVALGFSLRRAVRHRTILRRPIPYSGRYWHVANLRSPADLDDELVGWLVEAYNDTPA